MLTKSTSSSPCIMTGELASRREDERVQRQEQGRATAWWRVGVAGLVFPTLAINVDYEALLLRSASYISSAIGMSAAACVLLKGL